MKPKKFDDDKYKDLKRYYYCKILTLNQWMRSVIELLGKQ